LEPYKLSKNSKKEKSKNFSKKPLNSKIPQKIDNKFPSPRKNIDIRKTLAPCCHLSFQLEKNYRKEKNKNSAPSNKIEKKF
jgi:hypothetical protein